MMPNISGSSSQTTSQNAALESYNTIGSDMVVGGGASMSKGGIDWKLVAIVAAVAVALFFVIRKK
jgi:hypothetical protein